MVVSVIATSCGSHRSEGTCLAAGVSSRQAPHLSLAGSYGPQSRNNHSWTPQRSCISRLWDILSIHGILLHILPVASFPSCGLQKIPLQLILHLQPLVFLFIVLYVFLVLSNPAENQTLWAKEKTVFFNTVFSCHSGVLARPEGFEPPTFWFVAKHSIQLFRLGLQTTLRLYFLTLLIWFFLV